MLQKPWRNRARKAEDQAAKTLLTVIFSRLGSDAGAEGTLTDFCKAALENGHRCNVVVGRSTLRERFLLRQVLRPLAPKRTHLSVRSSFRVIDFFASRGVRGGDFLRQGSLPTTSLRFVLNPLRFSVRRSLARSTHVIVGQVLTRRGENELREICAQARLILNHNGEPTEFHSRRVREAQNSVDGPTSSDSDLYSSYFDEILFQNEAQKVSFEKLLPGVATRKSVLWPSCDETSVTAMSRAPSPFEDSNFNIVCVAKFQDGKGQLDLLSAFSRVVGDFPRAHLSFIGGSVQDRTYLDKCVDFVQDNDLVSNVSFIGARKDAPAFTAHCDLFVLTSEGEGLSRAIREAAFLSKPIVATALASTKCFLTPQGAFYCPDRQPEHISLALAAAMSNEEERNRRATVAKNRYEHLCSWSRFSSKVGEKLSLRSAHRSSWP